MEPVEESTIYNIACTGRTSHTLLNTQKKLSSLSSKAQQINHTGEAQYLSVVKGSVYKPHRGEPYLSSRSTLSCIRAVSRHQSPGRILSSRLPLEEEAAHTAEAYYTKNNASTDNTKPHNNIRSAKYPLTRIEQPHTYHHKHDFRTIRPKPLDACYDIEVYLFLVILFSE